VNAWTLREMGSTRGRGRGGGPGPPSEEQDKQLISNSGGDETPMGNQEDSKTSPTWHQQPIMHRVHNVVNDHSSVCI
jgi:hypothetical protein